MLTLYSHNSPNVEKVRIALNEIGVPYTEKPVDLKIKAQKEESYLSVNPNGRVPAIVDDNVVLWESGAILIYLANKHGRLLPAAPAHRAEAVQYMFLEASALSPVIGGYGIVGQLSRPEAQRDPARLAELHEELARLMAVVDRVFSDGREYFAHEYSIADIQMYPVLGKAAKFGLIKPSAAVAGWLERMSQRPAVRASMFA